MSHKITDYKAYKGVPLFRDYNVCDGEQVYIGNGQGCRTFWFKTVQEAKDFIDHHRDTMTITDLGCVMGLIPKEVCLNCKGHYSFGSPEWHKAERENCQDIKELIKKGGLNGTVSGFWKGQRKGCSASLHLERC